MSVPKTFQQPKRVGWPYDVNAATTPSNSCLMLPLGEKGGAYLGLNIASLTPIITANKA